jgi:hypothetical protein
LLRSSQRDDRSQFIVHDHSTCLSWQVALSDLAVRTMLEPSRER